jgi:peptide-methionine (S)-S-oxide reductase
MQKLIISQTNQLQKWVLTCFILASVACQSQTEKVSKNIKNKQMTDQINPIETDTAIFGAGCFWCVEAVFQRVPGVQKLISGYSGGQTIDPTYKEVCEGNTGHAEVVMVVYNPKEVSFETLLSVFWQTHNPTTLNRQGNDIGTQYRSAIFYVNEVQKTLSEQIKAELDKSGAFDAPIVTEITALSKFYNAEDYHQNYYNQNSSQGYCQYVIAPKLEKFEKVFGEQFRKK